MHAQYIKQFLDKSGGVTVDLLPIETTEEIIATVEAHLQKQYDMVMSLEGCILSGFAHQLSALCQDYGVMLFGEGSETVEAGADFGYGGGNEIFAHKAVGTIRKICEEGNDPGEIPIVIVPNNRSYWINQRVLDHGVLTPANIKVLVRDLEAKVQFLQTKPEDVRQ